jgi:uncharacterized membrane protein YphA (DoxX/SURF4 family)
MNYTAAPPQRTLALALAILRISLGLFLLIWALEKFVVPQGTVSIWKSFYSIDIGSTIPYIVGVLETLLALAITVGLWRPVSYGLGLAFHAISVAATWKQLLDPWGLYLFERPQHLFLAGVPVLAGFVVLYLLRNADIWTVDGRRLRARGA